MEINETLTVVLIFVFGIVFFVILSEKLVALDTSGWTFTGSAFLITFLPYVPWLFLIGILSIPLYLVFKKTGE